MTLIGFLIQNKNTVMYKEMSSKINIDLNKKRCFRVRGVKVAQGIMYQLKQTSEFKGK